jgi:hypothetical protein
MSESRNSKPEDFLGLGDATLGEDDGNCRYQYGSSSTMMMSYLTQTA